ncbi:SEC-C metal-binding domain-containing protein [Vibrio sp.]|uniref:SEC-C metal-binding domain-containing protein n=1 Tax=Vibrio sp. TaxID=678 RepID=UPI003D09BED3
MTYQLINFAEPAEETPWFFEGAILAANFTTQPLEPESWLTPLFGEQAAVLRPQVTEQIQAQYQALKSGQYSLLTLLDTSQPEQLADLAEGFMSVWPQLEPQWQQAQLADGTLRMLQALLTTFMLAIDEAQTREQMELAGIVPAPRLTDFVDQLDVMVSEVALAADELMHGSKAQSVNPFKQVGRNQDCPCGSGNKFKHCCGQ